MGSKRLAKLGESPNTNKRYKAGTGGTPWTGVEVDALLEATLAANTAAERRSVWRKHCLAYGRGNRTIGKVQGELVADPDLCKRLLWGLFSGAKPYEPGPTRRSRAGRPLSDFEREMIRLATKSRTDETAGKRMTAARVAILLARPTHDIWPVWREHKPEGFF